MMQGTTRTRAGRTRKPNRRPVMDALDTLAADYGCRIAEHVMARRYAGQEATK